MVDDFSRRELHTFLGVTLDDEKRINGGVNALVFAAVMVGAQKQAVHRLVIDKLVRVTDRIEPGPIEGLRIWTPETAHAIRLETVPIDEICEAAFDRMVVRLQRPGFLRRARTDEATSALPFFGYPDYSVEKGKS